MGINFKFSKSCRDDMMNRSLLSQFYNLNQLNDYFMIKECKSIHLESLKISFVLSARQQGFASTTLVTILAYSLIIAIVVFLLVFCTAMSLFAILSFNNKEEVDIRRVN